MEQKQLYFKVHIPNLLKEIAECGLDRKMGALKVPINELRVKMIKLSEIAQRINDDELNLFCLQNALYEQGDPDSNEYAPKYIKELEKKLSKN